MQLPGNLGDKCGSEGTSERRRAGCAAAKRATRSLQRTRCERMKGGGKKKKAKGKKGMEGWQLPWRRISLSTGIDAAVH